MKKIFALALVIVMMAAISIPAFAEEVATNTITGNAGDTYADQTYVSYGVDQTYTVVIPAAIEVNKSTLKAECPVKIMDVCIPANQKIKLSVTSKNEPDGDNVWQLEEKGATGATPVPYTVANSTKDIVRGGEFMTADSAVNFTAVTETLTLTVSKTMQVAIFEDYLTFSVAIA